MAKDLNRSIKIFIDNANAVESAEKLRKKVAQLGSELETLATTNGKDSEAYKKKQKAYDSATRAIGTYENKVKETEKTLKNLSGATYNELIKAKTELRKVLQNSARDTEQYRASLTALGETEKKIADIQKDMRNEGGRQEGMWCRAADWINKYAMLIAGLKKLAPYIKNIAAAMGVNVEWGGDWRMCDYPHFELKE